MSVFHPAAGRVSLIPGTAAFTVWGCNRRAIPPRDRPSGKRQYQPIMITKEIDAGSPSLFRSVCNHEVFDKLNIDFEQADSKGLKQPYLAMNPTNVTIVDVKRKPHPGRAISEDAHELEEISFTYQKIAIVRKSGKSSMDDDWVAG
jgi:type VI secretion system Hcp family effector